MSGFAILLLIVAVVWLLWPVMSKWLRRKANEKTEDFLRNAMGMPPRPGSRKERRQQKEQDAYNSQNNSRRQYGQDSRRYYERRHEPLIPKEYAEDVEYVETKSYSSDDLTATEVKNNKEKKKIKVEKQVSDAEWTEIK